MPRIRTIKPEFWSDEKLAPLSDRTRLVFLGLLSMSDDMGRLIDSARQIDAFIFAFNEGSCAAALVELAQMDRIQRGETASGQRIIQIRNWGKHQRVDHPNRAGSLPPIREPLANDSRGPRDGSVPVPVPVPTTSTSTDEQRARERHRVFDLLPECVEDLEKTGARAADAEAWWNFSAVLVEGGDGKSYRPAVIKRALSDLALNGDQPRARSFRAYLEKADKDLRDNTAFPELEHVTYET